MSRFVKQKLFSYPEVSKAALLSPAAGKVVQLYSAYLMNRGTTACDLGVLKKLSSEAWLFGQIDDSAAPDLVDQTAAIQAGSTVDIFTTTANDGFLVQARHQFHMIGLTLTQGQTGTPVYAVEYWNGSAWTAVALLRTTSLTATGDVVYLFAAGADWVKGTDAAVGGNSDYYAIRIRATTAGTQAVQANAAWVGELLAFQPNTANGGSLGLHYVEAFPEKFEGGEELLPYYSIAFAGNLATVKYFQEG